MLTAVSWIVRPSQLATPLSPEILPWLFSLHLLDLTEMERGLGVCVSVHLGRSQLGVPWEGGLS